MHLPRATATQAQREGSCIKPGLALDAYLRELMVSSVFDDDLRSSDHQGGVCRDPNHPRPLDKLHAASEAAAAKY